MALLRHVPNKNEDDEQQGSKTSGTLSFRRTFTARLLHSFSSPWSQQSFYNFLKRLCSPEACSPVHDTSRHYTLANGKGLGIHACLRCFFAGQMRCLRSRAYRVDKARSCQHPQNIRSVCCNSCPCCQLVCASRSCAEHPRLAAEALWRKQGRTVIQTGFRSCCQRVLRDTLTSELSAKGFC